MTPNNTTPTIGRIVLHYGADGKTRPAIVTHVWSNDCVNLNVFPKDKFDETTVIQTSVNHHDLEVQPLVIGHVAWSWMPYQKAVVAGTIPAVRHAVPERAPAPYDGPTRQG